MRWNSQHKQQRWRVNLEKTWTGYTKMIQEYSRCIESLEEGRPKTSPAVAEIPKNPFCATQLAGKPRNFDMTSFSQLRKPPSLHHQFPSVGNHLKLWTYRIYIPLSRADFTITCHHFNGILAFFPWFSNIFNPLARRFWQGLFGAPGLAELGIGDTLGGPSGPFFRGWKMTQKSGWCWLMWVWGVIFL